MTNNAPHSIQIDRRRHSQTKFADRIRRASSWTSRIAATAVARLDRSECSHSACSNLRTRAQGGADGSWESLVACSAFRSGSARSWTTSTAHAPWVTLRRQRLSTLRPGSMPPGASPWHRVQCYRALAPRTESMSIEQVLLLRREAFPKILIDGDLNAPPRPDAATPHRVLEVNPRRYVV